MKKLKWQTVLRTVSELTPNERNPRTISPRQTEDLKRSLRKFDLVEIPVIDTNNRVIAGHQRLMVLKLLGRENETIEVRVPNRKLTQEEYDQYLLSSNRIHGDWDWDRLAESFDIETLSASGFDDTDLSDIFEDLEVKEDEFDIETELKRIRKPKTRTGDIYVLGNHRLACGDSTDPQTVKTLLGGLKADTVLTDPPYNISLDYDKGVGGKGNYGGHVDDQKSDEDYTKLLRSALANGLSACGRNAHIFTYCDQSYIWLLQTIYKELGIENKRVCLWIKNNSSPTPHASFNKCYEPCVYGTIGKPYLSDKALNINEIMNKEVGTGNQAFDDIMDMLDIWLVKRLSGNSYNHPTEKSPTLHEKALRRCTKPNDIVLDLFAGSGSLLIACEQLKRRAFLVEREPIFCDLIIRRFEMLTGTKAVKI